MDTKPFDLTQLTQKRIDRFWSRVNKTDTCWLWTGGAFDRGYGAFCVQRNYGAHRISYMIANGVDPFPLQVLHTCDIPLCVNPAHLFIGTGTDNMVDKVAKGRATWNVGSDTGNAVLNEQQVKEIKEYLATGNYTTYAIAEAYHVSQVTIWRIKSGQRWKHVV